MIPLDTIFQPIWWVYVIVRVLFILIDAFLFFLAIFAGVELLSYRPHFVKDPAAVAERHKQHAKIEGPRPIEAWKGIRAKAEEGSAEAMRIAIIEADGFVDDILKKLHYAGETFADRLSTFNPRTTATLDRVWDAHRLRNDIVHTPGFEVTRDAVHIALDNYEAFLREIGGL